MDEALASMEYSSVKTSPGSTSFGALTRNCWLRSAGTQSRNKSRLENKRETFMALPILGARPTGRLGAIEFVFGLLFGLARQIQQLFGLSVLLLILRLLLLLLLLVLVLILLLILVLVLLLVLVLILVLVLVLVFVLVLILVVLFVLLVLILLVVL